MVKCPLPPVEQWDDVMRARMLFLLDKGLSPQLFLPASRLPVGAGDQVCSMQHSPDCSDANRQFSVKRKPRALSRSLMAEMSPWLVGHGHWF